MLKHFVLAICTLCAALFLTACGSEKEEAAAGKRIIGIVIPSADHGWTGGIVSWAERAKEDIEKNNPDVEVVIVTAASAKEQVDGIESLMTKNGLDTLVLLPVEPEPLTPVCKRVKEKGIYLVVVDRGLSQPVYDLEVVGDNTGFGEAAARAIGKELNGKGEILVMENNPCQVNTDRLEGFTRVMASEFPGIRILQIVRADWNEQKGFDAMESMLLKYPRIDAVWTGDDDVLRGALKAYRRSGRTDVKLMVGGGGSKDIVKLVKDGDPIVRLTVTYPPKMIYEAAMLALKKRIVIPTEIVTKENADQFYYPDSRY